MEMANTYDQLAKDYYRQLYLLIGVSVVALGLLVAVIVLARKGNGSGSGRPGSGRSGKGKEPEDNRLWAEPEEEIPTSKIKRYSREEFDRQNSQTELDPEYQEETLDEPLYADDAEQEVRKEDDFEEDDFIEETSLEDFERDLKSSGEGNSGKPREKGGSRPVQKEPDEFSETEEPDKDEDDFEYLDLDD